MRLILASASATRRAMLERAGVAVEARAAAIDEEAVKQAARADGADAAETALLLAEMKARRVSLREPEALVIGADQILVCDGDWFSKPPDMEAAAVQLRALRGRVHELATAVVCMRGEARVWHHVARPRLTMRPITDQFLDAYLAPEGAAILSSVGAYRLEGAGVQLFDRVDGDYFSILGLPLLPLLGYLRQTGALAA